MAGAIQDNLFIGRRAQELRGLLHLKYPMEHGVVTDWDDMERIWGWVYGEGLKALSEEVSPPLDLTSPSHSIRGYMGSSRDEMHSFRSGADWVASGIVHRGAIESTSKSRYRRSDLFRNI
jgi:centractin